MCYFDEFAKWLMEPDWEKMYKPTTEDHTKSPDERAAASVTRHLPTSASYILTRLSTCITQTVPMPQVIETVLHAANAALDAGGIDQDDLKSAVGMAQNAKIARTNDGVFEIQEQSLANRIDQAALQYVKRSASSFDWDGTFDNIDRAVKSGKINSAQGNTYKSELRSFSFTYEHDITHDTYSTRQHLDIVRDHLRRRSPA